MKLYSLILSLLLLSTICWGDEAPERIKRILDSKPFKELIQLSETDIPLEANEVASVSTALWKKYQDEQKQDPVRVSEVQNKEIRFDGQIMRFDYSKIGQKPEAGYPLYIALHGGGQAPRSLNDSQWEDMKGYYKDSVRQGIYLAPRAIANTWNLHSMPQSYTMYDRIIEDMTLFEDVNPNQVYVLGFSAGGDGTWQIAPRMPDRWAAANASAGHPNSVSIDNLFHLPFLTQVGEMDSAYNRNRVAAEYHRTFDALQSRFPQGYIHETYIHADRGHNFPDNDSSQSLQKVMVKPVEWLERGNRTTFNANTNAISWLSRFTRNPLPKKVIWDLRTRADRKGEGLWMTPTHGQQNYWLDIGNHGAESLGIHEISVSMDQSNNSILVENAKKYLKILVTGRALQLSRPVTVTLGAQHWDVTLIPNLKNLIRTLADRGDPNYLFEGQIILTQKEDNSWILSQGR